MTNPKKFWLANGDTFAQVIGADERDRLSPLGWTAVEEPAEDGWVHIWHEGVSAPGRVPVAAMETLWGPLGWVPGPPPGGASPFTPESPAEPAAEPKPSKPAAGGDAKKE